MSDLVQILERGYRMMWREGRIEDALRGLDDDFEWIVPNHPEGAVHHGPDSVVEFVREWREPWVEFDVEWQLHQGGPDKVLAVINMYGRGRESGAPAAMRFFQVWTFRNGRATRMVMYNDEDEARREAGIE
jgi:ketosteroid isomerase-like protein